MATIIAGDESGNLGFAFNKNATTHFVIALLRFEDADPARRSIDTFKSDRRLKDRDLSFHELAIHRWSKTVFDFVASLQFEGWVLAVNKQELEDPFRAFSSTTLYSYTVSEALSFIPYEYRRNSVVILDEIDESGRILLEIGRVLKLRGIHRGFKKIVAKRSSSEPLLQVADLIAGSVYQSIAKGDDSYLSQIRNKLNLRFFPEKRKTT